MFKRRGKKTFIVDATPVDLDFNKKTKEHPSLIIEFKMELFIL
jgi:hypothetical protein